MVEPSLREYLVDLYTRSLLFDVKCSYENYVYKVENDKIVLCNFVDYDIVIDELNKNQYLLIPPYFEVCDLSLYLGSVRMNNHKSIIELGKSFETIKSFKVDKSYMLYQLNAPSVQEIKRRAFSSNSNLTKFMGENVIKVEIAAFMGATSLGMVYLPHCKEILERTFYNNINLTSINLESCELIEDNSFCGCDKLVNVKLNEDVKNFDTNLLFLLK